MHAVGRWCAAALLLCGGRYLMQLRDDKPGILLPDHWALFGGTVDDGEDAAAAMRRELIEELELRPRSIIPFTEMTVVLPFVPPRIDGDQLPERQDGLRKLTLAHERALEPEVRFFVPGGVRDDDAEHPLRVRWSP